MPPPHFESLDVIELYVFHVFLSLRFLLALAPLLMHELRRALDVVAEFNLWWRNRNRDTT
jgi:hypothetical protein